MFPRVETIFPVASHLAITPGAGVNGVWVEPVPKLVTGDLQTWSHVASVQPIRIPGYWLHKSGSTISVGAPPMPGEKVFLILHGGGYTRLSAHPSDPISIIPRALLDYCGAVHRAFSLEYRLSIGPPTSKIPANPFPAALLDALAGYHYLVNVVGFSPSDIIVEGDSAGGNLALALTRYLVEYRDIPDTPLPAPPGALILSSPWVDLGTSHNNPTGSCYACVPSDILGPPDNEETKYCKSAFVGPHGLGAAEVNRYISPASMNPAMNISFKGFPRTFIIAGGAEVLYDQITTLKHRMEEDLRDDKGPKAVTFYEGKDSIHDYLGMSWHEPERRDTMRSIAQWVSEA